MTIKKHEKERSEINDLLYDFYQLQQESKVEEVFTTMLSPNLQQLTTMKEHSEKYQCGFKFGRHICWTNLFELIELKPGRFEGTVIVCTVLSGVKPSSKTKKYKEADKLYSAYKIEFIFLQDNWYIDEITPYREFWSNEFREFVNQSNN